MMGEIRFFRLTAIGLTTAAGIAFLASCVAQQTAHMLCGVQSDDYQPPGIQLVQVVFGAGLLLSAWLQWKGLGVGIALTGCRLACSAAAALYLWEGHLKEFLPGFRPLAFPCSGLNWHEFLSFQGLIVLLLFFSLLVIFPLSAIAHILIKGPPEKTNHADTPPD
jgi:hypothetical protein